MITYGTYKLELFCSYPLRNYGANQSDGHYQTNKKLPKTITGKKFYSFPTKFVPTPSKIHSGLEGYTTVSAIRKIIKRRYVNILESQCFRDLANIS